MFSSNLSACCTRPTSGATLAESCSMRWSRSDTLTEEQHLLRDTCATNNKQTKTFPARREKQEPRAEDRQISPPVRSRRAACHHVCMYDTLMLNSVTRNYFLLGTRLPIHSEMLHVPNLDKPNQWLAKKISIFYNKTVWKSIHLFSAVSKNEDGMRGLEKGT